MAGQIGTTRHWLDIHVLMGLTAPFIIAFHSTLKFKGIAGMAFWIMFAVSASGVVGRYLYAQIPRKVTTAELSMKELQELQAAPLAATSRAEMCCRKPTYGRCCACPDENRVGTDADRRRARLHDDPRRGSLVPGRPLAPTRADVRDNLRTLFGFLPRAIVNSKKPSTPQRKKPRSRNVSCSFRVRRKCFISGTSCTSLSATPLPFWRLIHIGLQFVLGYF